MNELALFAGAGGGILGGMLHGWRTVAAVEIEDYARRVLLQRQADEILPRFPIWDDVRTFDGKPWRGKVDVITGGFPCQDISAAGKGAGIEGERSGLWSEMARIASEVQPRFIFIENSPLLVQRGLAVVLCDLAEMGFDARWGVMGAHHVGAPHKRDRIWIVADSYCFRELQQEGKLKTFGRRTSNTSEEVADASGGRHGIKKKAICARRDSTEFSSTNIPDTSSERLERQQQTGTAPGPTDRSRMRSNPSWWITEPDVGRVANGVAHRVDRLKAIGNGQVSAVAALAWQILTEE